MAAEGGTGGGWERRGQILSAVIRTLDVEGLRRMKYSDLHNFTKSPHRRLAGSAEEQAVGGKGRNGGGGYGKGEVGGDHNYHREVTLAQAGGGQRDSEKPQILDVC